MKRIFAIILTFLVSCASSPESEPTPEPRSEKVDSRPAPASLRSCLEALGAAYDTEMQRADASATACGKLWTRAKCSNAWDSSLDLAPGARAPHIMSACASAYCPQLRPAPRLCERDASTADLIAEDEDWLELWTSFNRSALADTLGEENAPEAAQFSRTLMLLVSMTKGRRDGS